MNIATANTHLEIWMHCPVCEEYLNCTDELKEELGNDLRAEDCEVEIQCSDCNETFEVTNITY